MFNILIVEDNADMRELFCTVLSDSGYRCIPAAGGLEALEAMDKEYIDLIVADIMMPGMDGYELTKTLRDAKCEIPVLRVTAKDQFEDMQKGFRAGSDDYMVKPVNVKELVLRVEALLRRAKIYSDKKIVVGSTVLDYDALTVTIHGKRPSCRKKSFTCSINSFPIPTKSLPDLSLWTKSGVCSPKQMSERSIPISTGCGTGSRAVPTLRLLRYGDWAIRR